MLHQNIGNTSIIINVVFNYETKALPPSPLPPFLPSSLVSSILPSFYIYKGTWIPMDECFEGVTWLITLSACSVIGFPWSTPARSNGRRVGHVKPLGQFIYIIDDFPCISSEADSWDHIIIMGAHSWPTMNIQTIGIIHPQPAMQASWRQTQSYCILEYVRKL